MATQKMRLGVPRIILPAIGVSIYMVVTVSSVCLPDALSFYASDTACGFSKKKFADVFLGMELGDVRYIVLLIPNHHTRI